MRTCRVAIVPAVLLATLATAAPAPGASKVIIRGAGFGHGVGLSQYGALGFAKRGRDHRFILRHYYRHTRIGQTGGRTVRVLLQTARRVTFSGATTAAGIRSLNPATTYSVTRAPSGKMTLRSPAGRSLGSTRQAPLTVSGITEGIRLAGRSGNDTRDGAYRGDLEIRPTLGGLSAINAVDLEDYVRGVVAGESPSTWPTQALRAQAIVARTYAVTTGKGGPGFDQYADTRSQVYNGIAGERPSTDEAVAATSGEVVTYKGTPVVTYYFSTSGGRTENVENVFIGDEPRPWLRSVPDPYDDVSPRHTWVRRMSLGTAQRRLGSLVPGRLRQIRVLRRGRSPRVVRAQIVGTEGRTAVTGPQLRKELGLLDTWATFTVIVADSRRGDDSPIRPRGDDETPNGGGAVPAVARPVRRVGVVAGRVAPAREGRWIAVQRRVDGTWSTQFEAPTRADGRYRAAVRFPGVYRVQYRREVGPVLRVR
jgi:stage II sporulation protein D